MIIRCHMPPRGAVMINVPEHPDELPRYAKVAALELLSRTPQWLKSVFYYGIFGSIPSYEIEGITERAGPERVADHLRKIGAIYITSVLFAFGGNFVFCWIAGTLTGPDAGHRLYYIRDYYNLALYVVIVPLYIAVGIMLIYSFFISKNEIQNLAHLLSPAAGKGTTPFQQVTLTVRSCISIAAVLIVSALLTANYMSDLVSSVTTERLYWFLDELNGVRSLNVAGTYYIIFNFLLLSLTIFCTLFFIANTRLVINAARQLELSRASAEAPVTEVRTYFDGFCWVYGYAKVLIVLYSLNLLIWRHSPAGQVQNFDIALVLLFIVGVFVISFPRQMLELSWYRYRLAKHLVETGKENDLSQVQDIRTKKILWTAWICNILITLVLVKELVSVRFTEWLGDWITELVSTITDWILSGPS